MNHAWYSFSLYGGSVDRNPPHFQIRTLKNPMVTDSCVAKGLQKGHEHPFSLRLAIKNLQTLLLYV